MQSESKGELAGTIERSQNLIVKETKAKKLVFGKLDKMTAQKEAPIGEIKMWLGIKKMVQ